MDVRLAAMRRKIGNGLTVRPCHVANAPCSLRFTDLRRKKHIGMTTILHNFNQWRIMRRQQHKIVLLGYHLGERFQIKIFPSLSRHVEMFDPPVSRAEQRRHLSAEDILSVVGVSPHMNHQDAPLPHLSVLSQDDAADAWTRLHEPLRRQRLHCVNRYLNARAAQFRHPAYARQSVAGLANAVGDGAAEVLRQLLRLKQ